MFFTDEIIKLLFNETRKYTLFINDNNQIITIVH